MTRGLVLLTILLCLLPPQQSRSWGFYGHRSINKLAVFTLPTELMQFYKQNLEYVSNHAVDPDMRRYVVKEEAPRHYIDIDHYGDEPFKRVPRKWSEAIEEFTEDTLQAYGIVPWHVEKMYHRLVYAFQQNDIPFILKTSADIGHYIADAHVPLHTTENYNGQMTNQHGIHGFWESRLPEIYADEYDFFVGQARWIDSPLDVIWDAVEVSHAAVDSVLKFEQELTDKFPADRKYAFEERGRSTVKTYSRDFSAEYHIMLDNMVERRMRASVQTVGSFWYSAWVEAGKPALDQPLHPVDLEELEKEREELEAKYRDRPVQSREHDE